MTHYPPDDHFLRCLRFPRFIRQENGGWHGNYDTPTGTKLFKEMIVQDVNHPSMIILANGNEGGHNERSFFTQEDIQQRPCSASMGIIWRH